MDARLRNKIEAAIEALIAALDAATPDADLEPEPVEDNDNGIADLDALVMIEGRAA